MLGTKRNLNDEDIVLDDAPLNDENIDNNNKRFKKDSISFEKKQKSTVTSTTSTSTGATKFITFTSFSGKKITKGIKTNNSIKSTQTSLSSALSLSTNKANSLFNDLLKKPINEILKEIEDIESIKLKSKLMINANNNNNTEVTTTTNKDNRLWVDKYQPSSFHDLLSDDTMNIEILKWLKLWDTVVFDAPLNKNLVQPASVTTSSTTSNISSGGYINKYNSNKSSAFSTASVLGSGTNIHGQYLLQEDGTPLAKIILLTGGPGLGKTTLAHILAKHAGYNPIEINASEDRSGEAFESKLLSSIEMKSLFSDKKPNCLIIDEIDGISGRDNGPIELLLKLIENSSKSKTTKKQSNKKQDSKNSDDEDEDSDDDGEDIKTTKPKTNNTSSTTKKTKKKKFTSRLLRPIICICNDQYVPSLRKLRQKAMVFNFQAPKKHQLLSRLKEICGIEKLIANDQTLNSLIDMTGSDIRSCVNSLQFIKSKTSVLNSELLKNKSNIVIGQKDMEKGLFEIWGNIFKSPSSISSTATIGKSGTSLSKSRESISNEHFAQLEFQVESCNQIDKLNEGIYENYLSNMSSDFSMEKTVDCLEWLVFNDQMNHSHTDEKYREIVPLAIHQRCTTFTPKVVLPHSDYDCFIKKKSNSDIKDSFYSDLPALIYSYLSKKSFNIDFLYPFVDIISMPVRVSNTHLYSMKEKANLNQLVETMKLYHLSYKLEKSTNNSWKNNNQQSNQPTQDLMQYKLEPPIDTLLYFNIPSTTNSNSTGKTYNSISNNSSSNVVQVKHIRLSNAQKQIISTAVQQYKPPAKSTVSTASTTTTSTAPSHVFKQPIPIKPLAPTVLKDFFGRIITQTEIDSKKEKKSTSSNTASNTSSTGPNIKYRFQEGFTDAVKKTVYVKDFL